MDFSMPIRIPEIFLSAGDNQIVLLDHGMAASLKAKANTGIDKFHAWLFKK
jgi:hypothetical protein